MSRTMPKLRGAFDRQSWLWLQDNNEEIANAVQAEVQAGATPDEIRRFILADFPDRSGLAARACSAARYLESVKA